MKLVGALLSLFLPLVASAQTVQPGPAQIVDFRSGELHLKGYLWKLSGAGPFPAILFSHGSGGADALHTGGVTVRETAETLASVFVKHGYAFFYPCRRGQGLSADQGKFIQDELKQVESAKGVEARQKLQLALLTGPHLDDTLAALSFLKTVPGIDTHRIAVVGHSFGGQLTLLSAEHDRSLRAAVTFGAAATTWAKSPELREVLLNSVKEMSMPVMLIHAANDFDTSPGSDLAAELERLHKVRLLKIYPPVGTTPDEGHNFVYSSTSVWETDVFRFLDENVRK